MHNRRATDTKTNAAWTGSAKPDPQRSERSLRVLLVSIDGDTRRMLAPIAQELCGGCEMVSTRAQALDALLAPADIVIIDDGLPDGGWADVLPAALATNQHIEALVVSERLTVDLAVEAMRSGASDLLARPIDAREATACLRAALAKAIASREREREKVRLERSNRRLRSDRSQMTEQVNVFCNDLVGAYQELAEQVSHMSLSSEFTAIIGQELDIEEVLRKGLEFMLTRTGPTNAAVYLPTNHSDFSLGAYVNYDCSRDEADVLLDHLADIVPPRFADDEVVRWFETPGEIRAEIDDAVGWLDESTMVVFPCRHKGETLAVLVFFRDANRRFTRDLMPQIETMGKLFGEQLARVIRVHHRRLADEEQFGFGFEDDGADEGFGGDMAA